jgi:phosphate transport system permease protein
MNVASVSDRHALADETTIPFRPGPPTRPQERRRTGTVSRQDAMYMLGAGISSLSTTMLIFGRLTSLHGKLGFYVVALLIYIVVYAVLVSLTENRPAVIDRVMTVLVTTCALIAFLALATVIGYTIFRGWDAIFRSNTYLQDLSRTGPQDGLDRGGIKHAIVGTLIMISLTLVFTVPLSVACAIYLNESRSRASGFVRTVVTAMTALPSILAGLFIFSAWILTLGFQRSGLAASIAVSIMMLPIMIRSADVVLRLVPGNLREASAALGAPQWRTVWHVVLPTARSGLMTSVILGVARGVGETAPVLLTAGYTATINYNPLKAPMVSLPLTAFELVRSPLQTQITRGFATAAVLMILVLILFSAARLLGGRPAGHHTKRQAKRATAHSRRDLVRMQARTRGMGR